MAVLWLAVSGESSAWGHLSETVLPLYVQNSFLLVVLSCGFAGVLGVSTAWLQTLYEYPLRRALEWLLLLPLAMPAYLTAMVYSEWFQPAGLIGESWFPLHSIIGVSLLMGFAMYPYVYMLARIAFAQQCVTLYEAAAMLGVRRRDWWWRVGVPGIRPALAIGLALVAMETLADFGTVSVLGVQSFTTGIYRSWYGMGDLTAAAQLSCYLLLFVFVLVWFERRGRRSAQYASIHRAQGRLARDKLKGVAAWRSMVWCVFPVLVGFALPLIQWVYWAGAFSTIGWGEGLWNAAYTTLLVALGVMVLTLLVAQRFAYQLRSGSPLWQRTLIRIAASGYAMPGSVIAVGVFIPLIALDKSIAMPIAELTNTTPTLWLSGTIFAVILACSIRFLTLALAQSESALETIAPTMDDAAKLLGANQKRIRREIHAPFLRPAMAMAAILLLADVIKELPATILLRPFNSDTLAVRVFELAQDGRLIEAAPTALLMIGLSGCAVLFMVSLQNRDCSKPQRSGRFAITRRGYAKT